jgi:hypothetical protein
MKGLAPLHARGCELTSELTVHFNLGVPAGYSATNFDTTEASSVLLIGSEIIISLISFLHFLNLIFSPFIPTISIKESHHGG